jgi:DNA-directed RNA polymerase specialized sigma24 family protein
MAREPVSRGVDEDGTRQRAGAVDSRRAGFEAFCREVEPRLRRAYVGWCGTEHAADATAEALAWAWEHLDELDELANVVGYLYRVGQTRVRSKRQGFLPVAPPVDPPRVEPGLVAAVRALPDRQRTAVWLCVACGFTHAEAASAMEISRTAVGTHVQRGMTALRSALGVELPEGATQW